MKVSVVTDSASALSRQDAANYRIALVPLRVVVDGVDYSDLSIDPGWFYQRLAAGAQISTSQPSPGALLDAYKRMAATGSTKIWSVHIGSALSGTLEAAAIAAEMSPVPVVLVDTGTASMPEGLCVLAAAAALKEDMDADVAAVVAAEARSQYNVFVSLSPSTLEHSGRLDQRFSVPLPVLSMTAGEAINVVGSATDMNHAVALMVGCVMAQTRRPFIAIGEGGATQWGKALTEHMEEAMGEAPRMRYTVPPSVGAHAGPTAGLVTSPQKLPRVLMSAAGTG